MDILVKLKLPGEQVVWVPDSGSMVAGLSPAICWRRESEQSQTALHIHPPTVSI